MWNDTARRARVDGLERDGLIDEHNQLGKRAWGRLVVQRIGNWGWFLRLLITLSTLLGNYTVPRSPATFPPPTSIKRDRSTATESSARSLTLSGGLSLYNGVVSLNGANSIGSSVEVVGGLLAVGNSGALGNGSVLLYGGELLATTTQTLTASIAFSAAPTIAAATGQTLSLQGGEQFAARSP